MTNITPTTTKKPLFTKDEKIVMRVGGAIGSALSPKNKVAGGFLGAGLGLLALFLCSRK